MSNATTFTFSVHPLQGEGILFKDARDLQSWVEAQIEGFSWFTRHREPWSFGGLRAYEFGEYLSGLRSRVESFLSDPSPSRGRRDEIEHSLGQWRTQGPRFRAEDARVLYCRKLYELSPERGVRTLLAFMSDGWESNDAVRAERVSFDAAFHALLFHTGLSPESIAGRVLEVHALNSQLHTSIEAASRERAEAETALTTLLATESERIQTTSTVQANLATKYRGEVDLIIEKSLSELAAFKKAVLEDVTLQAPVAYWTTRSRGMDMSARKAGIAFLVGFFLFCLLMWYISRGFITEKMELPMRLWTITALVAMAGILAWPLRIIARLYMSAIHLRADAEERRTMVMTYLALLKEQAVDPKHREIVLTSLFRPSPTGIVSDDGAPASLADIAKAFKPGS